MKNKCYFVNPFRKRKLKSLLLPLKIALAFIFISSLNALADSSSGNNPNVVQQIKITGLVTDASTGEPLGGVSVIIEGTTIGTSTDMNGNYSIEVPGPEVSLSFSFIGYITETIQYSGQSSLDVALSPDVQSLDEVVVIGYGSQRKKDITSAITVVDTKALSKLPVANVTNALQGLTAGVEVQSNQGRPGELPTVRIRGVSSTNNTDPLYVIDGIPSSVASVNAEDIESMQVLKDAASCAIYGSRGANGVIIITTKSGKSGAPKVTYDGYYGFEQPWKTIDLLNIQQWADLVVETNNAGGGTIPPLASDIVNNRNTGNYQIYDGTNTDWQNEIFQTGAIHENTFSISGGSGNGNYYISANEFNQEGIMIYTPYKRYSIRANSNWETTKFKFGENISFIYSQNRVEASNGGRSIIEEAVKMTPNIKVRNPDVQGGYSGYDADAVMHDASNPVGSADRTRNYNYNKRFFSSVYGEYSIFKALKFRSTFGLNSNQFENRNLVLKTNMLPKAFTNTTLGETAAWDYNWTWENMLTFSKVIGIHDITVMGAYTSEAYKYHDIIANANTLQTETNDILKMPEAGETVDGNEREISRISYLGRIQYILMGKYMLTANFRRDGSSKFPTGSKWGNFPSASVAWRISEEDFLKNVDLISNLKLRASYGKVGNDAPVAPYSYISGLSAGQDYTFPNPSTGVYEKYSGVSLTGFNNPDITWETVKQLDFGLDLGLFKGAFDITVDYFDKKTEDMLIGVSLPASSGSSGSINKNLGTILNRGIEFSATGRKNFGGLNMSITANFATLHNEVLDLNDVPPFMAGDVEFGQATRVEEGYQIGSFYGYKSLGVFKTDAEAAAYVNSDGERLQPDAMGGDIKWADLDGDGAITSDDRYIMGNPIPSLTYGLTASLAYKGFDLSLFFQGVSGNDIYAEMIVWTEGMHNNFNSGTAALDRWRNQGDVTDVPRAVRNDPNGNISKISDRYIKDGSYLRLKNLVLGYTIPKSLTDKLKISNLRIYGTSRNLLTFTKYPFYDPEIGSGAIGTNGTVTDISTIANLTRGIDNGYYPQARTFIFGIQLDF